MPGFEPEKQKGGKKLNLAGGGRFSVKALIIQQRPEKLAKRVLSQGKESCRWSIGKIKQKGKPWGMWEQ